MEDLYRSNLIKSFKKNIDGGYFQFLVVDSINSEIDHFRSMWSHAKQNGFEVMFNSNKNKTHYFQTD